MKQITDAEQELLFRYSEWLDSEHIIVSDQGEGADIRTHDQLVKDFITAQRRTEATR